MRNTIEQALHSHQLRYHAIVDKDIQTIFKLGVEMDNGRYDCIVDIRPQESQVLIYINSSNLIPVGARVKTAEFITRANYGLIMGNFELDFEDGEVRYKNSYIYDDTFPNSEEVFIRYLFTGLHMIDRYVPGIMSVIYANVTPEAAINQIENVSNPSLN